VKRLGVYLSKVLAKFISPILPDRFLLPFQYFIAICRGERESELKYLSNVINSCDGAAVDIGANQGLYSYKLSKMFPKVYAFEVNSDLTKSMIKYSNKITVINKGLSDINGSTTLYIPVVKDLLLTGWASFSKNNCPFAEKFIEKKVEILPLDSFGLEKVLFIKIDVEGHEIEVLRGAFLTIERERPQILIEVKKEHEEVVFSYFDRLSYQKLRLEELIGKKGEDENYFFFPIAIT